MKTPTSTPRHQVRSENTRDRLIDAAEKIFARDGFEAARLEDIAAEAGYTRGAFYANFESKEALFLALLEREISSRIARAETETAKVNDPAAKLRALREFFLTLFADRRWSLLALEFKLFAVRHSEVKAQLAAMNRRLSGSRVGILRDVMQGSGHKLPVSATAVATSLSAVTQALALENMLDRAAMPEAELRKILAGYFDSLVGGQPEEKIMNTPAGRKSHPPDKRRRRRVP